MSILRRSPAGTLFALRVLIIVGLARNKTTAAKLSNELRNLSGLSDRQADFHFDFAASGGLFKYADSRNIVLRPFRDSSPHPPFAPFHLPPSPNKVFRHPAFSLL